MNEPQLNLRPDCPSDAHLRQLLRGTLAADRESQLAEHLNACVDCQRRLDALSGARQFAGWKTSGASDPTSVELHNCLDRLIGDDHDGDEQATDVSGLLTPASNPELLGMFGSYEVMSVVGHGGMGIVLKARDPSLDRIVAIKTLLPHTSVSQAARERFFREAKNAAAVNHPNIVTIYAVDLHQGMPFLVMEFVQGRSLEQQLAAGPLAKGEMLRISHQVAQALVAAHAQGLVHRDIKPANILLDNGVPRVKVTDFGLARAIDDTSLTRSGTVAGTPHFMSPEQAEGKETTERTDLFSLGTVIYLMCSGKCPFRGEAPLAVMRQVCDAKPESLRALNPTIPVWVERLVERLLSKNPQRRPSAQEVVQLLGDQMSGRSQPATGGIKRAVALVAGALVACTLVGTALVVVAIWFAAPASSPLTRSPASPPPARVAAVDRAGRNAVFAVAGHAGSFETLAEAVAAAKDGDTLRISQRGPFDCAPIDIAGKALVIEAADGVMPVLLATHESGQLLRTDSALTLRGLELLTSSQNRATMQLKQSVVRCTGGAFVMEHCLARGGNGIAAVRISAPVSQIRNCLIVSPNASGIVVQAVPGGTMAIDQCVLDCRMAITAYIESPGNGFAIGIRRSTFSGATALRITSRGRLMAGDLQAMTPDGAIVRVDTVQSLFAVERVFMCTPPRFPRAPLPASTLQNLIHWADRQSFYLRTSDPAGYQWRRDVVSFFAGEDQVWSAWRRLFDISDDDAIVGTARFNTDANNEIDMFEVVQTDPPIDHDVGAEIQQVGPNAR